ncbi:MAG: ABC transporter permease, partial [Planctomycetota bacterium]
MSPGDLFRLAGEALAAHKVRKRLTVAAVAVGVGAVMLLTTLGESARGYILNQFSGLGSNLLIVIPGKVETSGGPPMVAGTTKNLTIEDAEALHSQIPRVVRMAPIALVAGVPAKYGGKTRTIEMAVGSTPDIMEIRNLEISVGSGLPQIDPRQTSQACVLGLKIKEELFGEENALGKIVRLGDYRFRVVGLIASKGESLGHDMDDTVVIPVANALQMANRDGLFRVLLQVRSFEEMDAAMEDVRRILSERHDQEDFTLITQQSVMESLTQILGMLTAALAAIAAISLAVAGVGIMNVMFVSVSERTPEIGLMKAVGASNRQVMVVFLAEAAALALTGGVIGIIVGYLGGEAVQGLVPALPVATPIWAIEAALVVAFGTGVFFGVVPALKAARVPPVEALRRGV